MKHFYRSIIISFIICLCSGLIINSIPAEASAKKHYKKELLVPGCSFHGVHGVTFDADDNLYAGSVVGMSIYKVDTKTGKVSTFIGPVTGQADDLEFGPNGNLVWTSYLLGKIHTKDPNGDIQVLAEGLMGINSLAFKQDGRLFASQVFLGDTLYEVDLTGKNPPRKIIEKMGGLNGFDFGPDGMLYGPLWFKGQIAKVNVDTGELSVVASGFKIPAAANFDSKGNLWVVDTALGEVVKVNVENGEKTVVAKVDPSIDNLAIDSNDNVYISNMANNGIYQIDTKTGKSRTVVEGKLSVPSGLDVYTDNGIDTVYVTDVFAYRKVNAKTGQVASIARVHAADSHLEYPMSIRVNEKTAQLCSWFTSSLQVMDRKTGKTLEMIHDLKAPHDALALPEGGYIVAETGTNRLLKVSGEHGKDRSVIIEDLAGPMGLTWADRDVVYMCEVFGGVVSKININNGQKTIIASGLKFPEGIDVGPDGNLFVSEVGNKRLIMIDPKDGTITEIAGELNIGLPPYPGLLPTQVPTGVAVSENGTIYVPSDLENSIYRFKPIN